MAGKNLARLLLARQIGADEVIDLSKEDFSKVSGKFCCCNGDTECTVYLWQLVQISASDRKSVN